MYLRLILVLLLLASCSKSQKDAVETTVIKRPVLGETFVYRVERYDSSSTTPSLLRFDTLQALNDSLTQKDTITFAVITSKHELLMDRIAYAANGDISRPEDDRNWRTYPVSVRTPRTTTDTLWYDDYIICRLTHDIPFDDTTITIGKQGFTAKHVLRIVEDSVQFRKMISNGRVYERAPAYSRKEHEMFFSTVLGMWLKERDLRKVVKDSISTVYTTTSTLVEYSLGKQFP